MQTDDKYSGNLFLSHLRFALFLLLSKVCSNFEFQIALDKIALLYHTCGPTPRILQIFYGSD